MASPPAVPQIPDEAVRRWRELTRQHASRGASRCSCGCRCDAGRPATALRDAAPGPVRPVASS
jgi:hypothetical protein